MLANVRPFDDLAHPLCRNLRDGNWLLDYVVGRLLPFVGTRQVSELHLIFPYNITPKLHIKVMRIKDMIND